MKLLLLLGAIVLVKTTPIAENCNAVTVKNSPTVHERETLKTGVAQPFMLAVDHSSNTLYFSYTIGPLAKHSTISAKIDLETKEFKNISSVPNGFAQAVDNTNNIIYIGGDNGIYKYDPATDTADLYAANNSNIWLLHFHGDLYYAAAHPEEIVHVVKNGESFKVKGLDHMKIDMFAIDKDDDLFYSNETGLYGQRKGAKDADLYKLYDDASTRGLTTDKNGVVHSCMVDGIYVVNKDAKRLDKIIEMNDIFGIAFDRDNNLIYSDENNVYLLKPNANLTC